MVGTVSLDPLPLKRVLAIDEGGTEHLPPEQAPEEKSRSLLQRIDFEQPEQKDVKKAKSSKETLSQSTAKWPWQGLLENLQLAQQELGIILDFLTHIEANDAITVASMVKPKQLLHEACSELALRAASKLQTFKKVGKYLKQTAKALVQQVDREAIFYGALMRLQQHWKVKRLRVISAGPGGNAGFTIDLSYPLMSAEVIAGLSARTASLFSVNVEQDSSGLLIVHLPGQHLHALQISFCPPFMSHSPLEVDVVKDDPTLLAYSGTKFEAENSLSRGKLQSVTEKDVGEAVNQGASAAHSILRRIQNAIIDEQIFEWTVREALQPASGLVITGIQENSLQISLGQSCSLVLELLKLKRTHTQESEDTPGKDMEVDVKESPKGTTESQVPEPGGDGLISAEFGSHEAKPSKWISGRSATVYLQQAFYQSAFKYPQSSDSSLPASKSGQGKTTDGTFSSNKHRDSGSTLWHDSVEAVGPLKHFSLTMRHRVYSSKVLLELENLVHSIPYLFLSFHPTWQARTTAWDLRLAIPQLLGHGWKMKLASWSNAKQKSGFNFHSKVVLSDTSLSVESLEPIQAVEGASSDEMKVSKHRCELSELSSFLLQKLAGQLVKWLSEEALLMGLNVKLDFLSLLIHLNNHDVFAIVATVDVQAYGINWWLHALSPKAEDGEEEELAPNKSHSRRFLGALKLETLRGILVDLLDLKNDDP